MMNRSGEGRKPIEEMLPVRSEEFRLFWPGISLKARAAFREVTDEDLQIIDGEKELFFGVVGYRCHWNRARIERWLEQSLTDMLEEVERPPGILV